MIAPRLRICLGAALATAACLLLVASGAALAAPVWRVTSSHGPQNMPPGGFGQYVVQVFNTGGSDSSGTYTVTDTLPPGFVAAGASGRGWACSGVGTGVVRCSSAVAVKAPGALIFPATNGGERGAAVPIAITVLAPGAPGSGDNAVAVSGGGAATPASTTDTTPVSATSAGFGFVPGSFAADAFDGAGAPERQAGSHPFEMRVDFRTNLTLKVDPDDQSVGLLRYTTPDEHLRTLQTKLPAGLIGNPLATPRCPPEQLYQIQDLLTGACPTNSQVGTLDLLLNNGKQLVDPNALTDVPVYNMEPPDGAAAAFAFSFEGNPGWILITLDPTDHYSVIATVGYTIEVLAVRSARLTLWGVPADPAHDALRVRTVAADVHAAYGTPSTAPIRPFLTMPSSCGTPGSIEMRADSWQHPDAFTPWAVATAATMSGCDDSRFSFDPSISVTPERTTPSTPTGLDVDLTVPQKDDTVTDANDLYAASGRDVAIPTPPLRDAIVTLPEGMAVSPSSANGLAACSPLQIGLATNDPPTCPDGSKLGTVTIDTPLLPDQLRGSVYLASQNDNPFGTTLALYLVASAPGVIVKLPGKVEPDAVTGQLKTTFTDNPQLPFSHLDVHFFGGPHAALVTPPACGTKTATADLTSWNAQLPTVHATSSFAIDGACAKGFDPGFVAGTRTPVAGASSPLVTRFTRTDGDAELSGIDVSLPPGLLGRVASVPLCADAAASAGACPTASSIGRTTVAAGPGPDPFYIADGRVYLTGPYKGAPFGLSIVVPAKAGPLDLGDVVVRAQVQIDRRTAALRVVSDPLPTILAGIPLQVRLVDVTVDRAGFALNPTNCAPLSASATLASTDGRTSTKTARFQVGRCGALPFAPRMSLGAGSRGHTHAGHATSLTSTIRMRPGQANLRSVQVTLPTVLDALLPVISNACTATEFAAGRCEQARAGTAVAVTPLLRKPLRGGVYFVKQGRPLPDMVIALRGQVAVALTGKITIPGSTRLRTTFDTVPDVPISLFKLTLPAGRRSPIGVVRDLCSKASAQATVGLVLQGQNGKVVRRAQPLGIAGCPKPKTNRTRKRS